MNSGFNPQARWDRNIPQSETNQIPEEINEKIEMFALFKNGKIFPRAFLWKNQKYKIDAVNYNWQERNGQETINYFSLACGHDLYQVSFNNTTLNWQINRIL